MQRITHIKWIVGAEKRHCTGFLEEQRQAHSRLQALCEKSVVCEANAEASTAKAAQASARAKALLQELDATLYRVRDKRR